MSDVKRYKFASTYFPDGEMRDFVLASEYELAEAALVAFREQAANVAFEAFSNFESGFCAIRNLPLPDSAERIRAALTRIKAIANAEYKTIAERLKAFYALVEAVRGLGDE